MRDLNDLAFFAAVAEHGGFTAAGRTRSAMSMFSLSRSKRRLDTSICRRTRG